MKTQIRAIFLGIIIVYGVGLSAQMLTQPPAPTSPIVSVPGSTPPPAANVPSQSAVAVTEVQTAAPPAPQIRPALFGFAVSILMSLVNIQALSCTWQSKSV